MVGLCNSRFRSELVFRPFLLLLLHEPTGEMKKVILCFIVVVFSVAVFISCREDNEITQQNYVPAPVACWSVNTNETTDSMHSFIFTSCASNATSTEWDFGDGNFSNDANPSHVYNHYGKYIVKQTVHNSANVSMTLSDTITVGWYSIDSITYRQLVGYCWPVSTACPEYLKFNKPPFWYLVHTVSSVPVTFHVADDPMYDIIDTTYGYDYGKECCWPVVFGSGFNIYPSQIVNNKIDFNFYLYTGGDTSKFTVYFKIVYR